MTWWRLDAVVAAPLPWMRRLAAHYDAPAVVGGTLLVSRVARALATPAVQALVDGVDAPALVRGRVALRLTDDAAVDAVVDGAAPAGPADVAVGLAATMTPLVEAVRAAAPVGRRGLRGLVADAVGHAAVDVAREGDIARARNAADEVLDCLAPWSPSRPAWFAVSRAGDERLFVRREVCCLLHRGVAGAVCTSCPLLDDAERRRRLAGWLSPSDGAAPARPA